MQHVDRLREAWEASEDVEDFTAENIADMFTVISNLQDHIEWMYTKPRKEDALRIKELEAELEAARTAGVAGSETAKYRNIDTATLATKYRDMFINRLAIQEQEEAVRVVINEQSKNLLKSSMSMLIEDIPEYSPLHFDLMLTHMNKSNKK